MPSNQQLVNLIANRAITLTGGNQPTFLVNFALLRGILQPEQAAMTAATPPLRMRLDTGIMTLNPPGGGNPVNIPTEILLGGDGQSGGALGIPENGETVIQTVPEKNGHILIAAGGNGARPPAPRSLKEDADGGSATVIGGNENLIIALGGIGSSPPGAGGLNGGDGGHATATGAAGNDLYSEGGAGGNAAPGAAGTPGTAGIRFLFPAVPGGAGGAGGRGGAGGKAYVVGGESSFGEAFGGNGGTGGPGGAPGPGAAGGFLRPAAPPGAPGPGGRGGDGGNVRVKLGLNSVPSATTAPGAGGGGAPPGVIGIPE